jgi:hypothetical protein
VTTVRIPNGFTPRPYQARLMRYFDKVGKRAFWCVHRRGGKDLTSLHQTCKMMLQRRGTYWHIFPTGEQGKKAIWEGFTRTGQRIMEQVFPTAIRHSPRAFSPSGEMVVVLKNGSIWRLMGSDKLEVVGAGPVGVVFTEFALAKPKTWDLIRPMLRENEGWAAFVTTPRGRNHAWELYQSARDNPDWFCEVQTLRDTMAYDPEATVREERASGMPEALIQQEYFCDWEAALVGSVWGDLLETMAKDGRIAAFDSAGPDTFTSWDLGRTDSTAIWWWQVNRATGGVDVVDHYENHGQGLAHYFGVVRDRAKERGWKYIRHWLPHDARAKTLAASTSIQEQAQAALGSVSITPGLSVLDGIQAARELWARPTTRFHSRCAEGLEALRAYRYEYDEDKKAFAAKPAHDWASHTADAARYMAIVAALSEANTRPEVKTPRQAYRSIDSLTLDELWDTAPRRN